MSNLKFPVNFLWGTSTSAHQVEGNNHNNWTRFEEMGRTESGDKSGIATDHYNRYQEDFDWAQRCHNNIHRLSIEWSRVEPRPGKFDQSEINHYLDVFKALRERKIKVMLTLFHYTLPIWFEDLGGFTKKDNLEYFYEFVRKILPVYQDYVDFWVTINEPTVFTAETYLRGTFPPGKISARSALKTMNNLTTLHKKVYQIIHQSKPGAVVGLSHNISQLEPYTQSSKLESFVAQTISSVFYHRLLVAIKKQLDFIGLNYYHRVKLKVKKNGSFLGWFEESGMISRTRPDSIVNDLGWEVVPEGLLAVLLALKKYQKPIIITENGVADRQDKMRSKALHDHLLAVLQAIEQGVDVIGYIHWTLIDNFEWNNGWDGCFGLIKIDRENNLARIPHPSFDYYAKICDANELVSVC